MAKQEVRAARLVQRRWRGSHNRAAAYAEALLKIQAVAKGHQERARIRAERQWAAESELQRKAADKARMVSECTAIIEKLGRRYALGRWEMAVWQERSVACTNEALVYQVCAHSLKEAYTRSFHWAACLHWLSRAATAWHLPLRVLALPPSHTHSHSSSLAHHLHRLPPPATAATAHSA